MKKVFVTGADGFIGQHLTRKLIDGGFSVRVLSKPETKVQFYTPDEVDCKTADIRSKDQLKGLLHGISTVYHLAAISRNDLSLSWEEFLAVNVEGTRNLLEEAKNAGVKRFVFISTVEAAGFGDGINPRTENDTPNPVNNYGKSKLEAEKVVLSGTWPMECTVLRLPMIYGPGTFLIVPKLFGMVRRGFYPLIGDGKTKMEFCYVQNAVKAIMLAGTKTEAIGELFYVSDERSYSIKEVIVHIAQAMNSKVRFIYIPVPVATLLGLSWELAAKIVPVPPLVSKYSKKPFFSRETVHWTTKDINIVSTHKIRHLLGYVPDVNIQDGCRITAQWIINSWQNA